MGYDARQRKEVPRSVTAFLEARVKELEFEIQQMHLLNAPQTSADNGDSTVFAAASSLVTTLSDVILPRSQNSYASVIYAAFQHPCSLPLPFSRQQIRHDTTNVALSAAIQFSAMPRTAADFMLKNYTEIHLPQYPCVYEPELLESYRKCFDAPDEAAPFDIFTVSMALAISANTLTWKNKTDAQSASAAFWATAREQFTSIGRGENDLQCLQVALLLSHYASTNPKAVDIFYSIGEAARICIHLGLHREPPADMKINPLDLDIRRRLFWTTYGIER